MEGKNFVVYKSSAGSGKTHTLVREYLILALSGENAFRNILAITFTNKAADEMKQRVLSYLNLIADYSAEKSSVKTKNLLKEIQKNLTLTEKEITIRSKNVLANILHNYSDFSVCTIDSFVHRIIKTFAHDLYISSNFEVELEEDNLLEQAIDILIGNAGINEHITKMLVEFLENKTDDEKSWHIENDIKNFARNLLKEDGQIYPEKIKDLKPEDFFEIIKKTKQVVAKFENSIKSIAKEADDLITSHNINNDSFFQGRSGIGKYFENLAKGNIDKIRPNSYVIKTITENKWTSGKADAADKNSISSVSAQLTDYYYKIIKLADSDLPKYILFNLILSNIYPIAVLNEIKNIIDTIKKENNIVHISEFNRIISGIVLNEPVPFIYERTGEKFKHFLIDEFQDTSTLQWHNLLPLIDNSLSEYNLNMVVGDGKQAIYRWRNGDVEQFTNLPVLENKESNAFVKERELTLKRNYIAENLDRNFRSANVIVDFNNKLFSYISQNLSIPYKDIYKDVFQKSNDTNNEGYVQIEFLDNKLDIEKFQDVNKERIKAIIEQLNNDNYQLKDIAILCRSNKNASLVAQYLLSEGIDVVSSESLLLLYSPVVNFLIACFKYLNSSDDDIAKYEIINYVENYLGNNHNLSSDNPKTFPKFETLEKFKNVNLALTDLCEALIRTFRLNKSGEVNPAISFFLDAIHEFSSKYSNLISDFLLWWDEKKAKLSLIVPAELNAVRIMTIHKAKGLQFPVVIYPFATDKARNAKDWLWVELDEPEIPELKSALLKSNKLIAETNYHDIYESEVAKSALDMINLLYVTLTRPEERLYVLTKMSSQSSETQKSVPDLFSQYLKSVEEWKEEKTLYSFGKTTKHISKPLETEYIPCSMAEMISNDWHKEIIIRAQSPEYWDADNPDKSRNFGNLIHTVFSKIKYFEDADNVLNQMLIEGLIDSDEMQRLKQTLMTILSNTGIKPFFTKEEGIEIKTEVEILSKEGKIFRPDRLIIKDKRCVVIDYKTGKPEEHHIKQLNKYGTLLSEMGFDKIDKYILFIDTKENFLKKI